MNSPSRPHFFPTKFKRKAMLTSSFNGPGNNFSGLITAHTQGDHIRFQYIHPKPHPHTPIQGEREIYKASRECFYKV